MGSLSVRVGWIPMTTLDSSTLTGSYQVIGNPLPNACFLVKIVNLSTVTIKISTDGVEDMDVAPSNSFFLYDESANANREDGGYVAAGTQFYIKGSAGVGSIYLVGQYRIGG